MIEGNRSRRLAAPPFRKRAFEIMLGHSAPKRPSDGNSVEHFKLKRPKDDALLPSNSGRNTPEGVFSSHYADLNKISQLEIGHTPETNLRDRSPSGVDENICYGMICDITAQVCSVPDHQGLALRQTGTSESNLVSFSLNILKDCGEIVSEDGKPIAQLNTKTHTILQHVSAEMKIAFTALFTAETITMKLSEAAAHTRMKPGDVKCTVNILICGSRGVAKDVASRLGKYRLFLQHPYPHVTDLAYENPQYLHIDGASLLMGSILPPLSIEVMEAGDDNSDLGGIGVAKNSQPDPWSVLDELSAPENLPQVEADERITTELLRCVL
ncbi:unnamed protein product [Clonostachys byssicola]|uniref:Uncharacterized protein n=1 Tax=Clonostachys byssicola TaxID=160290 RepID=A0A9N9UIR5_9HYPO|nr:unnamed protein product [Clonostachys byssicola]